MANETNLKEKMDIKKKKTIIYRPAASSLVS